MTIFWFYSFNYQGVLKELLTNSTFKEMHLGYLACFLNCKKAIAMQFKAIVYSKFRKYALSLDVLFFYFQQILTEIQLLGNSFLVSEQYTLNNIHE